MTDKDIETSKTMSYALRHRPDAFGLSLDGGGWVDIDAFCSAIEKHSPSIHVDIETINRIISESDKKRFEISDGRIRATYGHSTPSKIEFSESIPPDSLFHGTSFRAYSKIRTAGLKPMNRQYVHLSSDVEPAKKVGKRHDSKPIILTIDSKRMHSDGFRFFHSSNDGTWMCDAVPSKYIIDALLYSDLKEGQ